MSFHGGYPEDHRQSRFVNILRSECFALYITVIRPPVAVPNIPQSSKRSADAMAEEETASDVAKRSRISESQLVDDEKDKALSSTVNNEE